jgi:hypothetical protein
VKVPQSGQVEERLEQNRSSTYKSTKILNMEFYLVSKEMSNLFLLTRKQDDIHNMRYIVKDHIRDKNSRKKKETREC